MRAKSQFQMPLTMNPHPLTLSLSPSEGERVQYGFACVIFQELGFANRLRTILPLPLGEGRGEGHLIANHQEIAPLLWPSKTPLRFAIPPSNFGLVSSFVIGHSSFAIPHFTA